MQIIAVYETEDMANCARIQYGLDNQRSLQDAGAMLNVSGYQVRSHDCKRTDGKHITLHKD